MLNEKYIILDTEETKDFCPSLINTVAVMIGSEVNPATNTLFYKLKTIDGDLLFLPEELQKVN